MGTAWRLHGFVQLVCEHRRPTGAPACSRCVGVVIFVRSQEAGDDVFIAGAVLEGAHPVSLARGVGRAAHRRR
jgi:hypothetical protein